MLKTALHAWFKKFVFFGKFKNFVFNIKKELGANFLVEVRDMPQDLFANTRFRSKSPMVRLIR